MAAKSMERNIVIANPPEVEPLKTAQVFAVGLSGPMRFQQIDRLPDIAFVPRLVREAHVRRVKLPCQPLFGGAGALSLPHRAKVCAGSQEGNGCENKTNFG